jgi:hypothetical protein
MFSDMFEDVDEEDVYSLDNLPYWADKWDDYYGTEREETEELKENDGN